jgi:mitochondrial import receptor subunit TOM20
MPQQDTASREAAQIAFVDYINKNAKAVPLLVARFIARQVASETVKLVPNLGGAQPPSDIPEAESGEYTMYDHVERLRYLEVNAPEEEIKIVSQVLSSALPGLEQFVTEERHATLLGKMAYNAYGVCFGSGRDDKVCLQLEVMLEYHL